MKEAVVVKLRLKNTALKVQKRKLLLQLRQVRAVLDDTISILRGQMQTVYQTTLLCYCGYWTSFLIKLTKP